MLKRLNQLFQGKVVLITNTNPKKSTKEGVCKIINAVPGSADQFYIVMTDGWHFDFRVDEITDTSVEQKRFRKIEVVKELHGRAFSSESQYFLSYPPKAVSPTTTNNILFESTKDIERYFSQLKAMGIISYYQFSDLDVVDGISVVYQLSRQKDEMFEVVIKRAVKFLSFS